jgi:outer membrane biosynthesis protein TonB
MMRLWKTSYMRPMPISAAALASLVVHSLIVGGWISATRPPSSMSPDGVSNRIYYIPPPDRPMASAGSRETIRYVEPGPGIGAGPGPASLDAKQVTAPLERSYAAGPAPVDTATKASVATPEVAGDSVFTILEVDSAVVRSQNSAAPVYPLPLLSQHIEGSVVARYVVDTTGFADAGTLVVLRSTNDGFTQAVRDALPYMRFSPAKIGRTKVRQLVEQSFAFKITPTMAVKK